MTLMLIHAMSCLLLVTFYSDEFSNDRDKIVDLHFFKILEVINLYCHSISLHNPKEDKFID